MNSALTLHLQALQRAWQQIRGQPLGTLLTLFVLGCALALPLSLHLALGSVTQATSRLGTDAEINVFLDPRTNLEEARALQTRMAALPGVVGARLVPKETALAQLKQRPHLADLVASLDSNPLPHAVVVKPTSNDPAALAELRTAITGLGNVDKVSADFEWVRKLARLTRLGQGLILGLVLILGLAVILIIGNTIRLEVLTRRDEIEVSQLIGASHRFVRRPFLYFGFLAGLGSALVAVALTTLGCLITNRYLQELAQDYGLDLSLKMPGLLEAGTYILAVAMLAWLGAWGSAAAISRSAGRA